MLDAADALFADADSPNAVSMDAIAAAAGVGKGTLFRAFGSRDGLLDELWAARLAPVREAVEGTEPPLGSGTPSRERIFALLDALLTFKLDNSHLIHAREVDSSGVRRSEHYRWVQGLLKELIEDAAPRTADAGYVAYVLLASLHIDLLEELLADGRSPAAIRQAQTALAQAVLDDGERG